VLDADVDSAVPWLATAYVAGPSLAEAVTGDGPMAARPALALAAGLAESLSAIHAAGVVHCDLKPSNVLLSPDGPRVIDFGISRAAGPGRGTGPAAGAGWVTGSPGFMSPEQALGGEIGPPSDIFSLGAVLTFAATGRGPFGRGSRPEVAYRLVYGPPDLSELPAGLRALVERCLTKDPRQRPTADEVLDAANEGHPAPGWLPAAPLSALVPAGRAGYAGSAARPSGRRWRRPLTAAGVTSGVLAASVAVSFALGAVGPRSPVARLAPRAAASPTPTASPSAATVPGTPYPADPGASSPPHGPWAAIVPAQVAADSPRPSRPPPSTAAAAAPPSDSPSPVSPSGSPSPVSPSPSPSSTVSPSPAAPSSPPPGVSPSPAPAPEITGSATYREGTWVYFDVQYADPGNDARGFGFMGVNGSRWMEATYPFSSPDEGIAGPGNIAYPLDLECGTAGQHVAEVEAWIYDTTGQSSQPVRISLACPS
jgi:serine/threonine protein kinase